MNDIFMSLIRYSNVNTEFYRSQSKLIFFYLKINNISVFAAKKSIGFFKLLTVKLQTIGHVHESILRSVLRHVLRCDISYDQS